MLRWCLYLLVGHCYADLEPLRTLEAVAVGHVQAAPGRQWLSDDALPEGNQLHLRSLSVHPPIFLIEGLLSPSEADELRQYAKLKKMHGSEALDNLAQTECARMFPQGDLKRFDDDGDGYLSFDEVLFIALVCYRVVDFEEPVYVQMLEALRVKYADKGVPVQFVGAADGIADFFSKLVQHEPHRLARHSGTAWSDYEENKLLLTLRKRAQAVTGLPDMVMNATEPLQLVHYPRLGHYSCHHDAHISQLAKNVVRLATLGVFLNDVPGGGELAFPAADERGEDGAPLSTKDLKEIEMGCQETAMCTEMGGVVVKPRRGDAVLWYNVHLDELQRKGARTPLEQTLRLESVHCGARVTEGEKWFANMWLRMPQQEKSGTSEEL